MSYNKKFGFVYLILVIAPLILIFSPAVMGLFKLDNDQSKNVSYALLTVAIITSVYILWKNLIGIKDKFWIVLSSITFIVLLLFLYSAYSLSNFGF